MDPGLSGLLGAIAGAIAAFGGVLFAQWRLEARETGQQRQKAAEAALISARILQGELAWAEARITQAIGSGKYWSARYALELEAWHAYREQMALALDTPEQWSCLRDGYRSIRTLELQASKRRRHELDRAKVEDWGIEQLNFGLERVTAAIEVLAPLANDRPRESLRRDPASTGAEPAIEPATESAD